MATKLAKTDIVVVGLGWAGGIISAELTKAGYHVVGLERGPVRKTADFLNVHDELRYAHRHDLMQDLSKDTVTFRNFTKERALPMRRFGAFSVGTGTGGGGVHWNGFTHLFLDYDFQIRSKTIERYGKNKVPADLTIHDWGITEQEIEPYFRKFVEMAGISGSNKENQHFRPRDWEYPTPPLTLPPKMTWVKETAQNMGLHPITTPAGNLSKPYTNPDGIDRAACQYCAFCARYGCEYGAKADPTVTVLPVAEQTGNFEQRAHATVLEVLHNENRATGVRYVDSRTGEEFVQPAEVVILSAYIYGNVKLLLNSNIGQPYDPETGRGSLGKNYSDHTLSSAFGWFEEKEFNDYAGAGALGVGWDDYNGDFFDHSDLDFIHGAYMSTTQIGNAAIGWNLTPPGIPQWGKEFKKQSIHYSNRSVMIFGQGAALPSKYNYLDLDPTYKDTFGQPLLRMTYNFTDNDRNMTKFLKEVLEEMGADHIMAADELGDWNITVPQSDHAVGGTPMGESSDTSFVNSYSQVWDMENLFVLGSSTFANQSGANPTGTLGALAYRAAEGIDKYLKDGGSLV